MVLIYTLKKLILEIKRVRLSIIKRTCIYVSIVLLWVVGLMNLTNATSNINNMNSEITASGISSVGIVLNVSSLKAIIILAWILYILAILFITYTFIVSFFKNKELNTVGYIALSFMLLLSAIVTISVAIIIQKTMNNVSLILEEEMTEITDMMLLVINFFNSFFLDLMNIFYILLAVICIAYLIKLFTYINLEENTGFDKSSNIKNIELKYQKELKNKIYETDLKLKSIELEKEYEEKIKRLNDIEKKINNKKEM